MSKTIKINNCNFEEVNSKLKQALSETNIITKKKYIYINKNKVTVIICLKKNKLKLYSTINYKNKLNMLLVFLGILFGILGVFIIIPCLYVFNINSMKLLKQQVIQAINN